MKKLINFLKDENAQAMAEYALLTFVFALAIVGTLDIIRNTWSSKWNHVTDARAADIGVGVARELLSGSVGSERGIGP